MNAGRLHAVLAQINREYKTSELLAKLQASVNALSASINSPTEANAAGSTAALTELYAALDQFETNSATSSQLEILNEIGAFDKVGDGLRAKIQSSLDSNNVTPANALTELQNALEVITQFSAVVSEIVDGFEALKIPSDELNPEESEIGVQVPWPV